MMHSVVSPCRKNPVIGVGWAVTHVGIRSGGAQAATRAAHRARALDSETRRAHRPEERANPATAIIAAFVGAELDAWIVHARAPVAACGPR